MLLSKIDIDKNIKSLHGWTFNGVDIEKTFEFSDFPEAIAFIVKAGIEAEKMGHHPDILLHSWNKVKIMLSTHDQGCVTETDFALATKIENLTKKLL
ncbi:MAG: 4a-hydroxytetrahydrobiopterin dehydratase [Ignavibacteriales bacterium]|nr:4a-hydroxytetrahydrobiopterin dehydratase [Ignavibacteriales bacterium]